MYTGPTELEIAGAELAVPVPVLNNNTTTPGHGAMGGANVIHRCFLEGFMAYDRVIDNVMAGEELRLLISISVNDIAQFKRQVS